jgi:hypothetical protein
MRVGDTISVIIANKEHDFLIVSALGKPDIYGRYTFQLKNKKVSKRYNQIKIKAKLWQENQ